MGEIGVTTKREQLAGLIAMGENIPPVHTYAVHNSVSTELPGCDDAALSCYEPRMNDAGEVEPVQNLVVSYGQPYHLRFFAAAANARATLRLVAEIVEAAGEVRRVAKVIDKLDNLADAYAATQQEDRDYAEAYRAESAAAIALDALIAKLDEQGGA